MQRILVTGGAGFMGSHVCKTLAQEGYEVLAADSLVRGLSERVKWCPLEVGDIADLHFLDPLFERFKPHGVIHLAAHSNPIESVANPLAYYRNNILATSALLEAMVKHKTGQIVFASSSTVYAEKEQQTPYVESDHCAPSNPYAVGKWTDEQLIKDFAAAYGFHYVIMRHFNPAGASSSGAIGELPAGNSHAVAALVQVALGLQPLFTFYGTDYPTPDGASIRDYVHIEDVAQAHSCALRFMQQKQQSVIANIGSGRGTSLKELLSLVQDICGHALPVEYKPRRNVHQPYLVADITAAREQLGWEPRNSSQKHIIETTAQWFRTVKKT